MNDPTDLTAASSPSVASEASETEHHLIRQAEVSPLDVDGVQAALLGTVIFAVTTVIMLVGYDTLTTAGHGWWLGVAVSGLGLGLVGLGYTISRRRRRRRRVASSAG